MPLLPGTSEDDPSPLRSLLTTARRGRRDIQRTFRRCQQRLARWGVAGGELPLLVQRLAEHRKRPILLVPVRTEATHPSGFWIETATADVIGYEADAAPTYQQHIIAHELGHIVLYHVNPVVSDAHAAMIFPDLDP